MYPVDPNKILALRTYKNLGQKEIAEALKMSLSTYANKEGKGNFNETEVRIICNKLNVEPLQILENKLMSDMMLLDMATRVASIENNVLKLVKQSNSELPDEGEDGTKTEMSDRAKKKAGQK